VIFEAWRSEMPDHPDLDAPQTLAGLFPDDDDEEERNVCKGAGGDSADGSRGEMVSDQKADDLLRLTFEVQTLEVVGQMLRVRQFDFHSHNANRVWPGTLNLAEYLLRPGNKNRSAITRTGPWGNILELGTATGLLAIRLASNSLSSTDGSPQPVFCCDEIVTSDVCDDDDLVAHNLRYNYAINGFDEHRRCPQHVPHTWGTDWAASVQRSQEMRLMNGDEGPPRSWVLPPIDTVVASDILLYVNSYPSLVQTLCEIIPEASASLLVMSWNRRMKESKDFFDRMSTEGFDCAHEGKCIYTFRRHLTGQALH
jgi:hypothetical protein